MTPGVAFDLSVNRESSAFMGSILVADVNRTLDFIPIEFTAAVPLKERPEKEKEMRFLKVLVEKEGKWDSAYLSLLSSAVLLGEVVVGSCEGRKPSELAVLESEEI